MIVDFFVSHAGRDEAWAEWVAWHLVEAGYTVELDCWDWVAGENFVARMHGAVDGANRVVALFSPAYFEEIRYTTNEWTSALVRSPALARTPVSGSSPKRFVTSFRIDVVS